MEKLTQDPLVIAGRAFGSRLMIGTGKYATFEIMRDAHRRSGAEVVTVAVRRVNLADRSAGSLMDFIDLNRMLLLPNTAACYTAEEAIRTARLGRELLDTPWVKLEVIGDEKTLFPDDLITARRLVDAGAAAIMPLAAPIGSGLGIQNFTTMRILREMITEVPIIVDAGVGTASDVAMAMELGMDGVLLNTAVAAAQDPGAMAEAMKLGVQAGRLAYLAGRMPKRLYASASSPLEGVSPLASGRP